MYVVAQENPVIKLPLVATLGRLINCKNFSIIGHSIPFDKSKRSKVGNLFLI